MNLLELRKKLRELSGRFDLVNEDGSDNGANFFIYEGQKHLDRLNETQKSWASSFRFIDVGRFSASVPYCRAIKEVWAASTTETTETRTSRWQLEKKDLQDLIYDYMRNLPSERTSGTPLYYSPAITRYIPENIEVADFESYIGWVDVPAGPVHEYNSILINVPTDVKIVVEVKGLFYTMQLVNDTDENYWSVMHPLLLISATQRMIEVPNRNTQGINDWDNVIEKYDTQLGFDLVEELIAEVSEMEG